MHSPASTERALGDRPARAVPWLDNGDRLAVALLVAFPAVLFGLPALAGYPLLTGDAVIQNFPLRALAGEILRHGHLPLLDTYAWAGTPLLGGINAAAGSPAVLPFALLPPLTAWTLVEICTYAAAALGLYVLLRGDGLAPLPAALGGATYGFAGFLSSQAVHLDVVQAGAALAWLLVALQHLAAPGGTHRLAWGALGAVATGSLGLAGSPEAAFYCALGAAVFAGHLLLSAPGRRGAVAARFIATGLVGTCIAAVQLLPGAAFVAASQRARVPAGFVATGAVRWSDLLILLAPHLLGGGPLGLRPFVGRYNLAELDGYAGLLALVAAVSLAVRLRTAEARRWRVWFVVGGLGLLLALGSRTPLTRVLAVLPVIGDSRLPSRALLLYGLAAAALLAHWSAAVLGGLGQRRAVAPAPDRPAAGAVRVAERAVPLAVLAVCSLVAVGGRGVARALAGQPVGPWSVAAVAPYLALTAILAVLVLVFVVQRDRLERATRARWLVGLVLVDLLVFSVNQSSYAPIYASALGRANAIESALGRAMGPGGRFVVVDPARSGGTVLDRLGAPNLNALVQLSSAQGYGSLTWAPLAQVTGTHGQDVVAPAALGGPAFDALGVTVLVVAPQELRGTPVPLRLDARAPTTRYFGRTVVQTVTLTAAGARDKAPGALAARLGATRLLASDQGKAVLVAPRTVGVRGGVVTLGFAGATADGVVLPPAGSLGGVTIDLETSAGRFSPTGPVSPFVTAPHWQLIGALGPYALFRNARALPLLYATAPGTHRRVPLLLRTDTRSGWTGSETVTLRPGPARTLVRSVAAIPGWQARADVGGSSRPLEVRRLGIVQAVALPAGTTRVEFTYTAPGLRAGLVLGGTGWAAVAVAVGADLTWARRRRARAAADHASAAVPTGPPR